MCRSHKILFLSMLAFFSISLHAQESFLTLGLDSEKEGRWSMIGVNRVHVQDFNFVDKSEVTWCCGQKKSYLDKSSITLGFGMYLNLSQRLAVGADLGATYGGISTKQSLLSDHWKSWSQTLRTDLYYHLGDPDVRLQPYLFSGVNLLRRKGAFYTALPVGMGLRFLAPNGSGMLTAQVGYGVGLTSGLRNGFHYSWGVYLNLGKRKRSADPNPPPVQGTTPSKPPALPDHVHGEPQPAAQKKPVAADTISEKAIVRDTDGDGVVDGKDGCVDVPGPITNLGCPVKALPPSPPRNDTMRFVVYFEFDRYSLVQNSFEVLAHAVDYLKRHPEYSCILNGHADLEGDVDYNQRLSDNRLKTARNYILSYNIHPSRILQSASFGKLHPAINSNDKALAWMNRRVEVLLFKR